MECSDRIAVQLTELVLQPVKMLRDQSLLTAVTLRAPGRGPRAHITVRKTWADGLDNPPAYRWVTVEVDETGHDATDGQTWTGDVAYTSPEEAYWAAVTEIAARRGVRSDGAAPR